jgi:hypothetical protein
MRIYAHVLQVCACAAEATLLGLPALLRPHPGRGRWRLSSRGVRGSRAGSGSIPTNGPRPRSGAGWRRAGGYAVVRPVGGARRVRTWAVRPAPRRGPGPPARPSTSPAPQLSRFSSRARGLCWTPRRPPVPSPRRARPGRCGRPRPGCCPDGPRPSRPAHRGTIARIAGAIAEPGVMPGWHRRTETPSRAAPASSALPARPAPQDAPSRTALPGIPARRCSSIPNRPNASFEAA